MKHKLTLIKAMTLIAIALPTLSLANNFPVFKTGQTESRMAYDDGEYQKGEIRSYTRDDDKEVVLDNKTNLMWQDNIEAIKVVKYSTDQEKFDNYYKKKGDTANNYCKQLTLGEYKDWRLPTIEELLSLQLHKKRDNYVPLLPKIFEYRNQSIYHTSTFIYQPHSLTYAWGTLGFNYPGVGYVNDNDMYRRCVRCVRNTK